jgi:3-hydroxyanthranilate 3,4-dioxygenase
MNISPVNVIQWLKDNPDALSPPVSNKVLFSSDDFLVMLVAGPNDRTDFHLNQTSEFFYQIQGEIFLDLQLNNNVQRVSIKEGEMYLLDAGIEHRPVRPQGTVGIVLEQHRKEGELDALSWYCDNCNNLLFNRQFVLSSIEKDLLPIIEHFQSSEDLKICNKCGTTNK